MIVFVTKNKDTFNNPLLYSMFRKLEEWKIESILISEENSFTNIFSSIKEINPKKHLRPKFRRNLYKYFISYYKYFYYSHFPLVLLKKKVKYIIGIDPEGIIWAGEIKNRYFPGIPLDYISFEIVYDFDFPAKLKEIDICNNLRYLIIQDELRDTIIRNLNHISDSTKSIYIPVSLSDDLNKEITTDVTDIRKEYGIPDGKKLIINFGSFEEWSGGKLIYDLIAGNHLKDKYVFVIHLRYPLNERDDLHKSVMSLAAERSDIIITNNYIDYFENTILYLKQFDFATVFYTPILGLKFIGDNIYNIGLSSGKFSLCMKAGLPAFTSNLPTYININKEYEYGFIVDNVSDIVEVLDSSINIEHYRENSIRLFEEKLNPTNILNEYIMNYLAN